MTAGGLSEVMGERDDRAVVISGVVLLAAAAVGVWALRRS
jgi:hypothetical protein